jgi:hypothetical protein
MTAPDYPQHPQQPSWDSARPAGQYPSGGRYPAGAQYPAAGQSGVGYPTGSQYPSAGWTGQYPNGTHYPPAYGPGQDWNHAGNQPDPGAGGRPPAPGGVGLDRPAGARSASGQRRRVDPAKILGLAVALLGALNFVFGFLPEVSAPRSGATLSVFAVGPAYVPILLLIAGLLALAAFLPGSERSRLAVAAVSVGGAAGAIVSLGTPGSFELFANPNQVSSGLGAILLVIFGIIQAVIAVGAYVVGADTLWKPRSGTGPAGPAPVQASPAGWDPRVPAPGPGPIDPSLVGVYPAERPRDVDAGYQGRGGTTWPTDQDAGQQVWVNRGASGYPPSVPGYGRPGESAAPVGGGSPSQPFYPEEPATGPQVVVGLETARVDTRTIAGDGSPATGSGQPAAAVASAGDLVTPTAEPADHPGSGEPDPNDPHSSDSGRGRSPEPEPARRQEP